MKREKTYSSLLIENIPTETGFQNKIILEIIGRDSGVKYHSAFWINKCLQSTYSMREGSAWRLLRKIQNRTKMI
jgi:hypothetical protein